MGNYNILIAEDNHDISDLLSEHLTGQGYHVHIVDNGKSALEYAKNQTIDLFILDWMIPELTGVEICQTLRQEKKYQKTPIILLTARTETDNVIQGLDAGANDYIKKPFDLDELTARIKNQLRGYQRSDGSLLKYKELSINSQSYEVKINNNTLKLTKSEFFLLRFLLQNKNQAFARKDLIKVVQGDGTIVTDRTVDTHMTGIRKKLGEYSSCIKTIRGVGYKFETE